MLETIEKRSGLIVFAILVVYSGVSIPELFVDECTGVGDCFDFDRRMSRINVWDLNWLKDDFRHSVHMGLLVLSDQLFDNAKFLVLVSSVILLYVSFILTKRMSGKAIGGIVGILVILSSSNFYRYDTSVTYPTFWATLYFTGLLLITSKKWYLSVVPYVFSIPAKALTALYFPATIGFIYYSNNPAKNKILVLYTILIFLGIGLILGVSTLSGQESGGFILVKDFRLMDFVGGFVSWMWKGFAQDQITLMLIFVTASLVFVKRKKIENSKQVLSLLLGMIIISPILTGMTTYDVWPYRMLPVVVVVGILSGMLVSNYQNLELKKMFLGKAREAPSNN